MRSRAFVGGVLFVLLLIGSAEGTQSKQLNDELVEDPMFGLIFSPLKVKYEAMSAFARRVCPDYEKGKFWEFANLHRGDSTYLVVLGVRRGLEGDLYGAALKITGSKCQEEDAAWMQAGFVPPGGYTATAEGGTDLPGFGAKRICDRMGDCHYVFRSAAEEDLLRSLAQDAIARGIRAWGGEARFKKEVCTADEAEESLTTPVLGQELAKFCKQSQ